MLELGRWSEPRHRHVGEYAASRDIDVVAGVGGQAVSLSDAAAQHGGGKPETHFFEDAQQAGAWLKGFVRQGDAILLKGSRGTKMELALAAFMEPD